MLNPAVFFAPPPVSWKMTKNKISSARELEKNLRRLGSPQKAKIQQAFFKTGPGQYAEGDIFLGVTVPETRRLVKGAELSILEIQKALYSKFHEVRLAALFILTASFERANQAARKKIFNFYMTHSKQVNNWDLVDGSAHLIAGRHLENKSRAALYRFAKSKNLWQRRIAAVSTWHEIRQGRFEETLKISKMLLNDEHDLIHKACGWMLREADKTRPGCIDKFLKEHQTVMPRTMLRYAIERFPENKKRKVMAGTF